MTKLKVKRNRMLKSRKHAAKRSRRRHAGRLAHLREQQARLARVYAADVAVPNGTPLAVRGK